MKATTWPKQRRMRGHSSTRTRTVTVLPSLVAAALLFAQCSYVPATDATMPAPPAQYGALIAAALKTFHGFAGYSNFQISNLRWVDAATGWSWLACVRYDDRGRERYYAFFIAGDKVVDARYDVRTDQCAAQQYLPFDVTTGSVGTPTPVLQQPIY